MKNAASLRTLYFILPSIIIVHFIFLQYIFSAILY